MLSKLLLAILVSVTYLLMVPFLMIYSTIKMITGHMLIIHGVWKIFLLNDPNKMNEEDMFRSLKKNVFGQ
jgi:hypothetical protein